MNMAPPYEDDSYSPMDLYQRYQNQFQPYDVSSYLDPEDPEVMKLRDLYARPTGSQDLVRSYVESRPRETDYESSFGRKMAGVLLGALSGNPTRAYEQAHNYVEQPYNDAYKEWVDRGKFIDDQARLLEADKAREIKATEFGLRAKNQQARAQAIEKGKARAFTGTMAGAESRDINAGQARALKEEQDKFRREQDESRLKNENERLNLSRERLEFEKNKPPKGHTKDVSDYAREAKANADLLERAKNDAVSHPVFKQYFKQVQDKTTGDLKWTFTGPPEIKKTIDDFVKARLKNYSIGLQPDLTEE